MIRRLTADDVDLYRSLRLRALQENPEAFGSTHERAAGFVAPCAEELAIRRRLGRRGGEQ